MNNGQRNNPGDLCHILFDLFGQLCKYCVQSNILFKPSFITHRLYEHLVQCILDFLPVFLILRNKLFIFSTQRANVQRLRDNFKENNCEISFRSFESFTGKIMKTYQALQSLYTQWT